MFMLADLAEVVISVDAHKHTHTAAVVDGSALLRSACPRPSPDADRGTLGGCGDDVGPV